MQHADLEFKAPLTKNIVVTDNMPADVVCTLIERAFREGHEEASIATMWGLQSADINEEWRMSIARMVVTGEYPKSLR